MTSLDAMREPDTDDESLDSPSWIGEGQAHDSVSGQASEIESSPSSDSLPSRTRIRSSIEFPYSDLEDALGLIQVMYQRAGFECTTDQLALWAGHANPKSGTFRVRLSASRMFGFIEQDRDELRLTKLGEYLAENPSSGVHRSEAFLHVPLYNALYDRFKGRQLPPITALENVIVQLGVSAKQKDRARQVFFRSAEQAHYLSPSRDRLVKPVGENVRTGKTDTDSRQSNNVTNAVGESGIPESTVRPPSGPISVDIGTDRLAGQHSLIVGLFETLPPASSQWSEEDRANWLKLAEFAFKVVYKDATPSR